MDMEKLKEQLFALKDAIAAIVDGMAEEVKPEKVEEVPAEEMPATETETPKEPNLAESVNGVGGAIKLAEGALPANGPRSPLTLEVAIIKPGWGNKRDNRFYSREMLARDSKVLEGAKMYTTDHADAEKSVRTEVSRIDKIIGFRDDGAPIASVTVFDPGFAEAVRNRAAANALDSLECSILGDGKLRATTIDGKQGYMVESITDIRSVDWVTKAGAGGRALRIAESETPATPTFLTEADVIAALKETKLPAASVNRLKANAYTTKAALGSAIAAEVAYLKEVTGSGQPVNGFNTPPQGQSVSLAEVQKAQDAINAKFLHTR